jgi:hypothetical protein
MSYSVSKYPIDFDVLRKGDFISSSDLENVFGLSVEDSQYSFKLMALAQDIEARTGIVCRTQYNGIKMLKDNEAVDYIRQQNLAANRKKRKQWRRIVDNIDVANLSPDSKRRFSSELAIIGAEVAAIATVRKQITESKTAMIKPEFSPRKIKIGG